MSYKELAEIEKKKYTERLDYLHAPSTQSSPEEIYLLLDPVKVEMAAEAQLSRKAHTIESWRNGIILLPLMFTWLSLGLAALAYAQIYPLHPEQPFLKQWADGFPGAMWWTPNFITTAGADALLIAILLTLTVWAQSIENGARNKAAKIRSWLEDELYNLARKATVRSLGAGAENKRPQWAVEVHSAILHLSNALMGVESLVKSSQDTLTMLVSSSQTTFENLVRASQEKLEGSVLQFSGALRDQREAVDQFMTGTVEVRRAVDKLKEIYVEGEHVYQELNATLPKMDASFKTMATRQDEAATALETISGKTNQATNAIGSIAAQFTQTQLVQSTYQAAMQMKDTADMMGKIALHMRETIDRQAQLQIRLEQQASYIHSQPVNTHFQQTQANGRTSQLVTPVPKRKSWFPSLRKRSH
jgi:hypothetical protein